MKRAWWRWAGRGGAVRRWRGDMAAFGPSHIAQGTYLWRPCCTAGWDRVQGAQLQLPAGPKARAPSPAARRWRGASCRQSGPPGCSWFPSRGPPSCRTSAARRGKRYLLGRSSCGTGDSSTHLPPLGDWARVERALRAALAFATHKGAGTTLTSDSNSNGRRLTSGTLSVKEVEPLTACSREGLRSEARAPIPAAAAAAPRPRSPQSQPPQTGGRTCRPANGLGVTQIGRCGEARKASGGGMRGARRGWKPASGMPCCSPPGSGAATPSP